MMGDGGWEDMYVCGKVKEEDPIQELGDSPYTAFSSTSGRIPSILTECFLPLRIIRPDSNIACLLAGRWAPGDSIQVTPNAQDQIRVLGIGGRGKGSGAAPQQNNINNPYQQKQQQRDIRRRTVEDSEDTSILSRFFSRVTEAASVLTTSFENNSSVGIDSGDPKMTPKTDLSASSSALTKPGRGADNPRKSAASTGAPIAGGWTSPALLPRQPLKPGYIFREFALPMYALPPTHPLYSPRTFTPHTQLAALSGLPSSSILFDVPLNLTGDIKLEDILSWVGVGSNFKNEIPPALYNSLVAPLQGVLGALASGDSLVFRILTLLGSVGGAPGAEFYFPSTQERVFDERGGFFRYSPLPHPYGPTLPQSGKGEEGELDKDK